MRFKVVNYSRLEIRLDTLHIYSIVVDGLLHRVDKPACRPLLLGTWSLVETTFHRCCIFVRELPSFTRLRLKMMLCAEGDGVWCGEGTVPLPRKNEFYLLETGGVWCIL